MDALILTFSKEQLTLYHELLKKDNIELNFDTQLPQIDKFFISDFDEVISNIQKEAIALLSFNKHNSSFSAFLTQEEIKELIPVYYNAIREIKRHSNIIGSEAWKLSFKLGEINRTLADINKRYSEFLPYKAALYDREEYSQKTDEINNEFKKNIQCLNELKNELIELFQKAEKISNIVSDFIKKSSKATDEPKFKKFDAYDFFWSLEAFIEQLKIIK